MNQIDSLQYRTLCREAEVVAQYSEAFGLVYGRMVTLWENTDELSADFWDYPVEYTVLCNKDGQLPRLAYQGGDLDEALKIYGETIAFASAERKAFRAR